MTEIDKGIARLRADFNSVRDAATLVATFPLDVAYAALVYGVQQYLVRPYVKGVGGTALYDFYWTSARIDQH